MRVTAKLLQKIAAEIIIVNSLPEVRAIKPEKADFVEALQVKTPEEITSYILYPADGGRCQQRPVH